MSDFFTPCAGVVVTDDYASWIVFVSLVVTVSVTPDTIQPMYPTQFALQLRLSLSL